ncbi:hypothetical protein [Streptomyces sp. NPDC017095]|uniref:hypothetical protein n=1 Tax=Streptomyces sp. NPDC017095 TaxID=3364977 RepID=UPI00379F7D26
MATIVSGPYASAVSGFEEALTLVAGGLGAMLTAAHSALYHGRPGVSYVAVEEDEPLRYALMWRSGDANEALRHFAALTREVIRETAPGIRPASAPRAAEAA